MKIPQIKPDWNTGIYIGNGVIAKPKATKPVSNNETDFKRALKEWALKQKETKQPKQISTKPTHQRGFFCSVRPGVQLVKTNNSSLRMLGTAVEAATADTRARSESEQL